LTAVLSYLMTRQQDVVGLTTFDARIGLDLPERSSPRHFNEMMQRLEAITPGGETKGSAPSNQQGLTRPKNGDAASSFGGGTKIADILHQLANRSKRRCLVVLISDLYDEPEAVMQALHHFRHRRHEVIVFHVLDKAELEFPFRDTIAFHDRETDERLQIEPAYVREEYLAQIKAFCDGYRRGCAEAQIDYVPADTSTPYDFLLTKYLAKRGQA
jgi:uncharacterized protein (DUF58 family)